MRISNIFVSNFLGITAADVKIDAPVALLCGRNGSGKSSIRDAVALALTSDLGRVAMKKEAPALIHDGADAAVCELTDADGSVWGVTIIKGGKITETPKGGAQDPTMSYVLDAQRFAQLDATERRAFLYGLMGVKTDQGEIARRLEDLGCDIGKVHRVLPLLRSGFDAAAKEAKSKATEAKGAWRAVTGETYGSEKAKTWAASVPKYDALAAKDLATELEHCDHAIEKWQREVGVLQAEEQRRTTLRAALPALQEHAAKVPRLDGKVQADQQGLADAEQALSIGQQKAGAAPRVGLVHEFAAAVARALPAWPNTEQVEAGWQVLRELLDRYEAEHGKVPLGDKAAAGDPEAQARLPALRESVALMQRALANSKRDLQAAQDAHVGAKRITDELNEVFDADALAQARQQIETLKAQRAEVVKRSDAMKSIKAAIDAAEGKTKQAGQHHADVAAWDAIGDALSPDGIPAQILAEALGPVNARLGTAHDDTGWPLVAIGADMAITADGRAYRLLSESERWRVNAMIAETIAHLSGTRLLVLDRFDVLDLAGRSELLGWLDTLADAGEIDTALIFGTLKAAPANLPPTIAAHWIENGVVGQLKAAA